MPTEKARPAMEGEPELARPDDPLAPIALLGAYNEQAWDRFRSLLSDECVYEEIGKPTRVVRGAREVVLVFQRWAAAVPEARAHVRRRIEAPGAVALEVDWVGALQAPFGSYSPAGEAPTARGALTFWLGGDRIDAFHHYYDSLVLYQVLGIGS